MNIKQQSTGFTLVELMVTLAILGFITAIAVPQYSQYRNKEIRSDAVASLSKLALEMERCKTQRGDGTYIACPLVATVTSIGGHYAIKTVLGKAGTTFTIIASKNILNKNTECPTLFMTDSGLRDATTANKAVALSTTATRVARCWGR